ncbi:MAG TPA: toll/interleukin-1 receptor domain-containing protein, partial [Pyrinomonadaceae bacterium]|nr:toll/interleukin-1 receptor domain-containing protein [Pyrinomonadaceae bacterium]
GAPVEEIRDIWDDSTFYAKVGPPASRVNAALYASPLCALGGVFTIGVGLRRRKDSPGDELVEVEDGGSAPAAGAAAARSAPEEEEEEISSTVYAPAQAAPGDGFLVQVFVHLPVQSAAVEELAKEADEDTRRAVADKLKKPVRRGTELAFHLQLPGLEVDEPAQTCLWEGEPARLQFGVIVPEDCKPRKLFGTVTVCENSVPVGHLKFMFKITGEAAAPAPEPVRADMTRYRQAFISYASKDRPEVLKRVQMLNSAKINFFQDLLTLEPGDEWATKLYEYIDKSDVFFLFWSKAASESEWVKREIEYARKASEDATPGPEIVPVIIEGPPHVPPPAELSFLHFNDKFLYFINTRDGA